MPIEKSKTLAPSTSERECTIRFNDTFSDPQTPQGAPPIYDFDSALTAQVRGNGCFENANYPIGTWTAVGEYGLVTVADLRKEQQRILEVYEDYGRANLPDAQVIKKSLDQIVIAGCNWAVRRKEHHEKGQNGDDFFIAELDDNIQVIAQLQFLRGVASRGLVKALWRIRDENPVWPKGEQYRSSIADQLRNFPEGLVPEELSKLPTDDRTKLFLAYADKYGNGRIGKPEQADVPEIILGKSYCLRVDGKSLDAIGANRLTDIPEDALGIYVNPSDGEYSHGIRYLELARRVADPNNPSSSAYEKLRSTILPNSDQHPDWSKVEIELIV